MVPADDLLVLLVDDIPTLRFVLRLRLEQMGFTVLEAPDGATGVEMARTHCPAMVLLDFEMPGMSGLEAAAALRASEETTHIPIVLLSSAPFESNLMVSLNQIGVEAFLMKPYDFEKLKIILLRLLGLEPDAGTQTA